MVVVLVGDPRTAELAKKPSKEILEAIGRVTSKRPRTVLEHILEHGFITTDELKSLYGYNHPPRAARDVREAGIPLETFKVKGPDGRSIAGYRLPADLAVDASRVGGRRAFPKAFKEALLERYGSRCHLCGARMESRALQIDHRIPYEIGGDAAVELNVDDFMLVCGSCNRSKSWTCEHCPNWQQRDPSVCASCAWAFPEDYEHVATVQQRRLTLTWQAGEVPVFDQLKGEADQAGLDLADYLKERLS